MCQLSCMKMNNKGADQPAHPRNLISAVVVRCLDSNEIMMSDVRTYVTHENMSLVKNDVTYENL